MKKNKYILSFFLLLLFLGVGNTLFAQNLNSKGKINNLGKITLKGQARISQDTVGGKVIYDMSKKDYDQYIEQITYEDLEFKGSSRKMVLDSQNLVIIKKFKTDTNLVIKMSDTTLIETKGETIHDALINPDFLYGKVIFNGLDSQDVSGHGLFKIVELDNNNGADVIDSGGFAIGRRLILRQGEFRNDSINNFVMSDSSEIVRYAAGSLQSSPEAENKYSVRYEGTTSMVTGGEIPDSADVMRNLTVNTNEGIHLSKKATVNDSLHVGGSIYTEADTLVMTSQDNPSFASGNPSAEVIGSMERKNIEPGKEYIFNNPYTKATFGSAEDMNGTKVLVSTIYPDTSYSGSDADRLVNRRISFTGFDENGAEVTGDVRVYYAYGWRHSPGSDYDETHGLDFNGIGLLRWIGDGWENVPSSTPVYNSTPEWGSGNADELTSYGQLALGNIDSNSMRFFEMLAYLEGAYIENSEGEMHTKLKDRGLLDSLPDVNSYPVNLIPNYQPDTQTELPDSVVDYIVIEFRPERNEDGFFKLGFIRNDGRIVDLKGNDIVSITINEGMDVNEDYFVALRHRNHAPVISADEYSVTDRNVNLYFDFTNPIFVEGNANNLKLVDVYTDENGDIQKIYALKAGFFPDEETIDELINFTKYFTVEKDRESAYDLFIEEGYLPADYDMNGIVNTKDYNYSWNNRLF